MKWAVSRSRSASSWCMARTPRWSNTRCSGTRPCTLELRPLIAFRDYHSITHANDDINPRTARNSPATVAIAPYRDMPRLHFSHNARWSGARGPLVLQFRIRKERERGLEFLRRSFPAAGDAVQSGAGRKGRGDRFHGEPSRRRGRNTDSQRAGPAAKRSGPRRPSTIRWSQTLRWPPSQFIVRRGSDLQTVIAGYHWFADWGRDTMIALPGLTLVTGRFDMARDILLAFSRAADQGMLPNRFPGCRRDAGIQHRRRVALVLRGYSQVSRIHGRLRNSCARISTAA